MSRLFYSHGKFCASHPWEVMVAFLSLSFCMFSMGSQVFQQSITNTSAENCLKTKPQTEECFEKSEQESIEVVILTISRCMALLYVYHQFRNLYKLGSKYLVGIAGLFTVFSSFIFCSGVVNFLNGNFSELNKALPFFLLLSDLSKASLLAQFALSSFTREEVRENIARGMAILGPSLTLDTMVETLAIGVGTVSGVTRLEEISCFACMSVLVNYVVFMTFFPACLSLALELSHDREEGSAPVWQLSSLTKVLQIELEHTPNPVIQRVKLIMSAGLMLVHTLSRWPIAADSDSSSFDSTLSMKDSTQPFMNNRHEPNFIEVLFRKIFAVGSEQVVMIGLVCALAIKYIFFENKDNYNEHIISVAQQQYQQVMQQNLKSQVVYEPKSSPVQRSGVETPSILITSQDSDTESMINENSKGKNVETSLSSRASSVKGDTSDEEKSPSFFIGDDYSSDFSEIEFIDREVQTDETRIISDDSNRTCAENRKVRDLATLIALYNKEDGVSQLNDLEIQLLVESKHLPSYKLESVLGNAERGVAIRRKLIECSSLKSGVLKKVPFTQYDYSLVLGACCENVIGYVPIPLGIAGPLLLNNKKYYVPMATTEGCLVASTNRGCSALAMSGGVIGNVYDCGMTRGPVISFPSVVKASEAMQWLEVEQNFNIIERAFNSTSRFARLKRIHTRIAGRYLYLRFVATTGDAMGMNMITKGTEAALQELKKRFPDILTECLSGNFCTDKKPSAVNWIEGRGKSVVCEAVIPANVIEKVLKTSAEALVELNISKNLVGSAIAGSIGGFNAQAANIVAAIYIATGQDPAQTVGSSNCITLMELHGSDLHVSCTMPSLEIGTIGGGTVLEAQGACLELLGVKGCSATKAGSNSAELASIVCATVLAAELSLMSALAAGHLVRSHMKHNRSNININLETVPLPSIQRNKPQMSENFVIVNDRKESTEN